MQSGITEPVKLMQERMLAGGSARNRLLVKGGSSFNALVRALKQDMVTGAAPKAIRNEQLMYDVDRVSSVHAPVSMETRALQADQTQDQLFLNAPQPHEVGPDWGISSSAQADAAGCPCGALTSVVLMAEYLLKLMMRLSLAALTDSLSVTAALHGPCGRLSRWGAQCTSRQEQGCLTCFPAASPCSCAAGAGAQRAGCYGRPQLRVSRTVQQLRSARTSACASHQLCQGADQPSVA